MWRTRVRSMIKPPGQVVVWRQCGLWREIPQQGQQSTPWLIRSWICDVWTSGPRWSMYGIFSYIYPINDPNVGKYTSTMDHLGVGGQATHRFPNFDFDAFYFVKLTGRPANMWSFSKQTWEDQISDLWGVQWHQKKDVGPDWTRHFHEVFYVYWYHLVPKNQFFFGT